MAIRSDVIIDWNVSPRIITVLSPSVTITIQDLLDTLRDLEDSPQNLSYPFIASAAGKEALGGGTLVGITLTLIDALLAFELRAGPTYVQMTVTGGNIVAVDSGGSPVTPISPTAFTQVVIAQSSSATLSDQGAIENILRNKTITDPITGIMTVYEADGVTVLYTAQMYEGSGTGQTYRGQGAERKERLT